MSQLEPTLDVGLAAPPRRARRRIHVPGWLMLLLENRKSRIGLIMLGSVINYLTRSTLAVAAPTLLQELQISAREYSWIVGAFQVGRFFDCSFSFRLGHCFLCGPDLLIDFTYQTVVRAILGKQLRAFVLQLNNHRVEMFSRILIWKLAALGHNALRYCSQLLFDPRDTVGRLVQRRVRIQHLGLCFRRLLQRQLLLLAQRHQVILLLKTAESLF